MGISPRCGATYITYAFSGEAVHTHKPRQPHKLHVFYAAT